MHPGFDKRQQPGVLGKGAPGNGRQLSQKGIQFIARGEGIGGESGGRYYPYPDIYGNPTVGYGHLIKHGEDFSKGITGAEALSLLRTDAQTAEGFVNRHLSAAVPQNEFDALVDVAFNSERAAAVLIGKVNRFEAVGRADFVNTLPHGAKSPPSLIRRREDEASLFLNGTYR